MSAQNDGRTFILKALVVVTGCGYDCADKAAKGKEGDEGSKRPRSGHMGCELGVCGGWWWVGRGDAPAGRQEYRSASVNTPVLLE